MHEHRHVCPYTLFSYSSCFISLVLFHTRTDSKIVVSHSLVWLLFDLLGDLWPQLGWAGWTLGPAAAPTGSSPTWPCQTCVACMCAPVFECLHTHLHLFSRHSVVPKPATVTCSSFLEFCIFLKSWCTTYLFKLLLVYMSQICTCAAST